MSEASYGIQSNWHLRDLQTKSLLSALTAALLTGLFWMYSMTVSPLVIPRGLGPGPGNSVSNVPFVPQPRLNREIAKKHLQLAPWASEALYQLRTKNAFVYSQKTEPIYDDPATGSTRFQAIRFTPFALVWMQKGKNGEEAPYVIVSESAYIKFANPVEDITNPNPGRVIGGTLEGEVKIAGPDGLELLGRDFWFSETSKSLWCDSPIQFVHGPHRGSALGLDAELIRDEAAVADDKFALVGVKNVRLRENVVMDLLFKEEGNQVQGLSQNADEREAEQDRQKKKPPVKVHIQSQGSFSYGVETHLATFQEDVRVFRPTEPGQYDVLFSHKLTLLFQPVTSSDGERNEETTQSAIGNNSGGVPQTDNPEDHENQDSENSRFQGLRSDLSLRSLHAEGKSVVLISEANDLSARMTDLIYDVKTKVAVLSDRDSVVVFQGPDGESEIHSPQITLEQGPKGDISSILCKGKGWLSSRDPQNGQPKLVAQWAKQMRKYPDRKSDLDIVELQKNATVKQPQQQMALSAELIRFWIKSGQTTGETQYFDSQHDPRSSKKGTVKERSEHYQLQYLVAEKNVTLINREMQAKTKRLEANFQQDTSSSRLENPTLGFEQETRNGSGLEQTFYRRRKANSSDPNANRYNRNRSSHGAESGGSRRESVNVSTSNGPMHVSADFIRVRVLQGENQQQSRIAEVWTSGNVRVEQRRMPGEDPLLITGSQMHVLNRGNDDQLVYVSGKPAHIRDPQMQIEGTNIQLDRGGNLVRVIGAGLLRLPATRTLEGEKLDHPEWLDIWWKEQMKFDGQTAQFYGNVRSVLNKNRINCEEMHVLLTKRLSFTEKNAKQKSEIHRVICKDNVDFQSFEYQGNRVIGERRGRFANFTLNRITGETKGAGPGWLALWRRGGGKRAGLTFGGSVQANSGLKPNAADWEYLRIDFAGVMNGNTKSQYTTFHDQVHIVYGPVKRLREVVDPDALPEDGGWMQSDKLRVTQHEIRQTPGSTKKPASYIDLLAQGNAKLKGRAFDARAGFINYDESKGLYVLWSLAPQKATIWRQTRIGGKKSMAEAQRMEFWPDRNNLKLDGTTSLEGIK